MYRRKTNKNVKNDPLIQKMATITIKGQYWSLMARINANKMESVNKLWIRFMKKEMKMQKSRIIEKDNFFRNVVKIFNLVIVKSRKFGKKRYAI
jgi:hypothetical protein